MSAIRRILSRAVHTAFPKVAPVHYKHWMELRFWRGRHRQEGRLRHSHYEYFYTTFFGLSREDYAGRRVLDIGCGPRGSLEWIAADAECIGIDPLVPQYSALGINDHRMAYVHAGVEEIPFPDGDFQVVTSFNNLDHVDNIHMAVAEIKRVTSVGGTFLLITEVEHEASATEPQNLPRSIASWFEPEFEILSQGICDIRDDHDIYQSLRDNRPFNPSEEGIVYARLVRR
jgi:ubiquinone/menaquinone biosynthesis C-methylase UbiE